MSRLGFVQADPIRAPARAQDLILRHRVSGYRVGDLERSFVRLKLEEHFLYAYGFIPGDTWRLMQPLPEQAADGGGIVGGGGLGDALAAEVLAFVRARGPTHPADLEKHFGRDRAVNGWGGFSKATTEALHALHRRGALRVARRRDGIRIYEAALPASHTADATERARRVVMLVAGLLAPASLVSLRGALASVAQRNAHIGPLAPVVTALLAKGELERGEFDGEQYIWPNVDDPRPHPTPRDVRLLAPFDPVVWDRRRFEHLWGWAYRFEAYVPAARRSRGYYAMPLMWGDDVVGWANVTFIAGKLHAELGYAGAAPKSRAFRQALDAELARMERFLTPRNTPRVQTCKPAKRRS